jgi:hypothetical protein
VSLQLAIAEAMAEAFGCSVPEVYTAAAGDVLAALGDRSNRPALVRWLSVLGVDLADLAVRDALVAGLVDAGVFVPAGCWFDRFGDVVRWSPPADGAVPLYRVGAS